MARFIAGVSFRGMSAGEHVIIPDDEVHLWENAIAKNWLTPEDTPDGTVTAAGPDSDEAQTSAETADSVGSETAPSEDQPDEPSEGDGAAEGDA